MSGYPVNRGRNGLVSHSMSLPGKISQYSSGQVLESRALWVQALSKERKGSCQ